ncbi:MAG: HNH endonuclease [Bacteroidetes bacterium]|nr:HNH endonuclease [Bacteroidota bacterium]
MIRFFYNEEWKEFDPGYKAKFRYAITNYGRLISFKDKVEEGTLLKGGTIEGYKLFRYKIFTGGKIYNKYIFVHKLVAGNFLPEKSEGQTYVIHLNHEKSNNHLSNLAWATREEMLAHAKKSPAVIRQLQKFTERIRSGAHIKLSVAKVQLIKKIILDPNRTTRYKIIARRFGISEMQLYRIKSGENWGRVKVPQKDESSIVTTMAKSTFNPGLPENGINQNE